MPNPADIQWVSWHSYFRGKMQRGKWHARIGFARGPKATLCSRAISPLDSIPMEELGSYRRESPPLDKKRVCQRCLKAATKLHEKESSQ